MGKKGIVIFLLVFCVILSFVGLIIQSGINPNTVDDIREPEPDKSSPFRLLKKEADAYLFASKGEEDFIREGLSAIGASKDGIFFLFNKKYPNRVLSLKDISWGQGSFKSEFIAVKTLKPGNSLLSVCGVFVERQEKQLTLLVAEQGPLDKKHPFTIKLRSFVLKGNLLIEKSQLAIDLSPYLSRQKKLETKADKNKNSNGNLSVIEGMAGWRPIREAEELIIFLGKGGSPNTLIQLFLDYPKNKKGKVLALKPGARFRHDDLQVSGQGKPTLKNLFFFPRNKTLFILGIQGENQAIPCLIQTNLDTEEIRNRPSGAEELRMGREDTFLLEGDSSRLAPSDFLLDTGGHLYLICANSDSLKKTVPFFYRYYNTHSEFYKK